jgi:ribosomal protein S8
MMLESSFVQERGLGDVLERVRMAWVDAAEKSLASNPSTVAVLSVDEILKTDGYVAELKKRGYVVADP